MRMSWRDQSGLTQSSTKDFCLFVSQLAIYHLSKPFLNNDIFANETAMTRVANAAAITLQTWSRTVLAKNQADANRLQQQAQEQRKSLELLEQVHSRPAGMEVWTRRALLVAACFALVGMNLQGGTHTQEILATSAPSNAVAVVVKESSRSLTQGLFGLLSEAVPSLAYVSRQG
jgi:ABC-type branched-subunit amino acid transport system ATPase component